MASALRPATALLGRLTYARKIAVLAVVLALPMSIVGWAYVGVQRGQISFTEREREGVRYLRPLLEVALSAMDARDRAVNGGDPAGAKVADAVAALSVLDGTVG